MADAESSAWLPVAVTLYTPPCKLAMVNAPDNAPLEIEHVCDDTMLPEIEQDVSIIEKPDPETSTVSPTEPEAGLSEIDGVARGVVEEAVETVIV